MSSNPCKVCGGTDLNLVDGFYYCVECGTQDVNVRETVVEYNVLGDGTFAHATTKKLTTVLQDANEMSGEWNKWHAYNFILAGLTEELLSLGAEPSVKTAVLWIWTKYIKMFQVKEVDDNKSQFVNESLNKTKEEEKDDEGTQSEDSENDLDKSTISNNSYKHKSKKTDKFRRDIKIVTRGTLLTILYVALNLDKSDIQLSHLLRFIKEGRLSLFSCMKFVPREINIKTIPHWMNFVRSANAYTPKIIRTLAMTLFKRLNLGVPIVPDLGKIISTYVKELCLPSEFKDLVFSLINLMPCHFLNLDSRTIKTLVRIPDYEGVCMSYILIALKMCFGLDSEYEIKVSNEVDRINYDENYLKSYKLGSYSQPTDRLLSFQEWYQYLLFRKTILCKHYLPMARLYKQPVDGCVLIEHLKERKTRMIKLSDNVTMDILNKIPVDNNIAVIPKSDFPPTLTPMTTYTQVILQYLQDPDLRLLLSEDFSQYSLKYVINDLKLPDNYDLDNIIQGVSDTNKCINPFIIGNLKSSKGDNTMVFVRNCENKNWLVTKPPKSDHVVKVDENKQSSDKESDHGYDSNMDSTPGESDETRSIVDDETKAKIELKEEKVFETFDEEKEGVCIFDDDFNDLDNVYEEKKSDTITELNSVADFHDNYVNNYQDSKTEFNDNVSEPGSIENEETFNPQTFDRKSTIEKLLEMACKKYKIRVPKERPPRVSTKRKKDLEDNTAGQSEPKRPKSDVRTDQSGPKVTDLVAAYYRNLENDIIHQVSEHVRSVIQDQTSQEMNNESFGNNDYDHLEESRLENNDSKCEENLINGDTPTQNASIISSVRPNLTINSTNSDTDEDVEENVSIKPDPNFDPATHDIEQLYVKLNEGIDFNYSINYENDSELDDIIDKSIENFTSNKKSKENTDKISDIEDSEDEIPLNELENDEMANLEKNKKTIVNNEYLVNNRAIKKYYYWMRHYKSKAMTRSLDMQEKFDIEITENCPKSFVFVIRECAAILDCSTFCLYKCMQNLEETLMCFCDR